MREFFRYIFSRTNLMLYVIGLALIVVGMALTSEVAQDGRPIPPSWLVRPLEPLGYALFLTALVAATLNFSFQSSIEAKFSIVKHAEASGVLRLFAKRSDALPEIAHQAERVHGTIDILCVSGTSLLQRNCPVLAEIGKRYTQNSSLAVRILLLDPRSRFAIERSLREEGFGQPNAHSAQRDYRDFNIM